MQHKVLSLKAAAEAAGVSLSTLKRLIAAGALRKVRVSLGRVGVYENELDEYLCACGERDAAAEYSIMTTIDQVLDRHLGIAEPVLEAVGGDRLPPLPLHQVRP